MFGLCDVSMRMKMNKIQKLMKIVNVNVDTGRRTEQEEDKTVLGRLKFLVSNLEMLLLSVIR